MSREIFGNVLILCLPIPKSTTRHGFGNIRQTQLGLGVNAIHLRYDLELWINSSLTAIFYGLGRKLSDIAHLSLALINIY